MMHYWLVFFPDHYCLLHLDQTKNQIYHTNTRFALRFVFFDRPNL